MFHQRISQPYLDYSCSTGLTIFIYNNFYQHHTSDYYYVQMFLSKLYSLNTQCTHYPQSLITHNLYPVRKHSQMVDYSHHVSGFISFQRAEHGLRLFDCKQPLHRNHLHHHQFHATDVLHQRQGQFSVSRNRVIIELV